ncbi:hypothetical protein KY333_04925 [Candidatus Woesearchaeota archaeon]|nr:hypothetical protein [Candidatus Woesearchaeota archaeon]
MSRYHQYGGRSVNSDENSSNSSGAGQASSIDAPAGTLSKKSAATGQVFSSVKERKIASGVRRKTGVEPTPEQVKGKTKAEIIDEVVREQKREKLEGISKARQSHYVLGKKQEYHAMQLPHTEKGVREYGSKSRISGIARLRDQRYQFGKGTTRVKTLARPESQERILQSEKTPNITELKIALADPRISPMQKFWIAQKLKQEISKDQETITFYQSPDYVGLGRPLGMISEKEYQAREKLRSKIRGFESVQEMKKYDKAMSKAAEFKTWEEKFIEKGRSMPSSKQRRDAYAASLFVGFAEPFVRLGIQAVGSFKEPSAYQIYQKNYKKPTQPSPNNVIPIHKNDIPSRLKNLSDKEKKEFNKMIKGYEIYSRGGREEYAARIQKQAIEKKFKEKFGTEFKPIYKEIQREKDIFHVEKYGYTRERASGFGEEATVTIAGTAAIGAGTSVAGRVFGIVAPKIIPGRIIKTAAKIPKSVKSAMTFGAVMTPLEVPQVISETEKYGFEAAATRSVGRVGTLAGLSLIGVSEPEMTSYTQPKFRKKPKFDVKLDLMSKKPGVYETNVKRYSWSTKKGPLVRVTVLMGKRVEPFKAKIKVKKPGAKKSGESVIPEIIFGSEVPKQVVTRPTPSQISGRRSKEIFTEEIKQLEHKPKQSKIKAGEKIIVDFNQKKVYKLNAPKPRPKTEIVSGEQVLLLEKPKLKKPKEKVIIDLDRLYKEAEQKVLQKQKFIQRTKQKQKQKLALKQETKSLNEFMGSESKSALDALVGGRSRQKLRQKTKTKLKQEQKLRQDLFLIQSLKPKQRQKLALKQKQKQKLLQKLAQKQKQKLTPKQKQILKQELIVVQDVLQIPKQKQILKQELIAVQDVLQIVKPIQTPEYLIEIIPEITGRRVPPPIVPPPIVPSIKGGGGDGSRRGKKVKSFPARYAGSLWGDLIGSQITREKAKKMNFPRRMWSGFEIRPVGQQSNLRKRKPFPQKKKKFPERLWSFGSSSKKTKRKKKKIEDLFF